MKEKIKQLRIELGLNQEQFAKELDITQAAVSSMETAVYGVKIDNLVKIMELYKRYKNKRINLDWLITGEGEKFLASRENESFKDRLNQYQAESGKSDVDLAKEMGINESRVEKLGLGKVEPTLEELTILKKISGKSLDWWQDGE